MKKYSTLISIIIIMVTLTFAQDRKECGETTDEYSINTREYKDLDIAISYSMGDIMLGASGQNNLIKGSITYDNHNTKPTVDIEKVGSSGVLTIEVEKDKEFGHCLDDLKNFDNELNFNFPPLIKTDLFLEFGVGEADINLTDLAITKLNVDCGLSDVEIHIDDRNSVTCESVNIENGLGDLDIFGLGNLAAKDMEINIGLGSATIDLSGDKIHDTTVDVDVGLGSLELTLPKNANIKLDVDSSFLSSINIYGLKQKKNKRWVSPNWKNNYPTIVLDINVGMGSVDIVIAE